MIERDKQKDDQEKKHQREQEKDNNDLSKQKRRAQPKQKHAGMATDPQTMKDKDYIRDIEEKTQKH